MSTSPSPLISVIVRSTDRATLDASLASIVAQTYPQVEVVVVCAAGPAHRQLPAELAARRLVVVPSVSRLGRSAAANAGLAAAGGELMAFLDDDDILLPDHLSMLAAELQTNPKAIAAYSRVQAADAEGNVLREFGQDYDETALHLQNYLPIHSVLFRRSAADAGARFDPRLDLCEDWDFWRQVAAHGPFLFVDAVTAIYRISEAGGFALRGDPGQALDAEKAVTRKWQHRIAGDTFYEIVVRARTWPLLQEAQARADLNQFHLETLRRFHSELNARHDETREELERAHAERARVETELLRARTELNETIASYENSRSWRITRPLRAAGRKARLAKRAARGFAALSGLLRLKVLIWLLTGRIAPARRQLALASQVLPAADRPLASLSATPACHPARPIFAALKEPVDVLIPIYNGFEFLENLFSSLAQQSTSRFRLLVCDDASPDERVWPWLQMRVADFPDSVLLRNESNLGFVGTVNRLFERVEYDFVLLNSDVEVSADWLERLFAPFAADSTIASATPFTNAGTICSFPHFFKDNPIPEGMTVGSIDAAFARLKDASPIELSTGVGFCMAIRLSVARRIGLFDPAFGRGYREENDWCERACRLGYRHVLVPNLFVHHKHGGSFPSAERQALADRNEQLLRARYPGVFDRYTDFIQRDPARPLREFMHLMVRGVHANRPAFAVVDNVIEGGAHAYSHELIEQKVAAGVPVLHLIDDFRLRRLRVEWLDGKEPVRLTLSDYQEWGRVLAALPVERIQVNNVYSFREPLALVQWLADVPATLGIPVSIALHDFFMLCPSLFLIDSDRRYCGLPDATSCERCFTRLHTDFPTGAASIADWRHVWGRLVASADELVAFSNSTRELVSTVYPLAADKIVVRPHSLGRFPQRPVSVDLVKPLHIGIVGSIAWHKGWEVVKGLCEEIDRRGLPYRVTVIGTMVPDFSARCLTVTGRYERANLAGALERSGANLFLFTSIWPETFSYVAHEIMACQVPLCCFDIGAPAESVARYPQGRIMPICSPGELLSRLEQFKDALCAATV